MPSVSVVIPNYNRAELVGETIENILSQSLPPLELIIVDDGSTDNSIEVIKSFGDRVKLVQQRNQGPAVARNRGLSLATGEFIQMMDSDDLFSKNKLEAQSRILTQHNSDIVFSPWAKIRFQEKEAIFEDHVLQNKIALDSDVLLSQYLRGWSTVFQTFMIRHSFMKKVGKYKEDLMPAEDIEFFVRILLNHPKISFTEECLTLYRLHEFAKISGDGTSLIKKLIDQGNYLRYTCQNLANAEYRMDLYTSLCFKVVIWKLAKELSAYKSCPADIKQFLDQQIKFSEVPALEALAFYLRVLVFLRKRLTGSYWRGYYSPAYPKEFQKELVRDLGFIVN